MPTAVGRRWLAEPASPVHLDDPAARATPAAPGDRAAAQESAAVRREGLIALPARPWADHRRALLVVT